MLNAITYHSFFEVGCRRVARMCDVQPCFVAAQCGRIMQMRNVPPHEALSMLLVSMQDIVEEVLDGRSN